MRERDTLALFERLKTVSQEMNERIGLVGTLTYVIVAISDPLFRDYSHIVWLQRFDRVEYRTFREYSFLSHTHTHTFDDIYFLAAKLQACTHIHTHTHDVVTFPYLIIVPV